MGTNGANGNGTKLVLINQMQADNTNHNTLYVIGHVYVVSHVVEVHGVLCDCVVIHN
jgi:heme/copper-type cytochrome/quinol oxidase subunit 1